jgi:hypothetical protein
LYGELFGCRVRPHAFSQSLPNGIRLTVKIYAALFHHNNAIRKTHDTGAMRY